MGDKWDRWGTTLRWWLRCPSAPRLVLLTITGSTGVFFLNMKDDSGVVVLKQGGPNTPSELFCTLLFNEIAVVSTPKVRVLHQVDDGSVAQP